MTVAWNPGFPGPLTADSSDVLVGLDGGTICSRFTTASFLFSANNLSDVASKISSFNNVSPLTTKGDLIWFDGTNNSRLGVGSTNQILSVGASSTIQWINNPGLLIANNLSDLNSVNAALTNLGLSSTNNVSFNSVTTTALNIYSHSNGLTAHAGGGQSSALGLTKAINRVTTVATAGDSVKLPAALAGESVTVINAAASNSMDCFPASGDAINALTANTQLAIPANKTVMFLCAVNGTWNSIVTA